MSLEGLDQLLRLAVDSQEIPGAVVLVRHDREVLIHEAYGFRQRIPRALPMGRDTLFDLASVTKPLVCGLLAMQLWRRGALQLDQPALPSGSCPRDAHKGRITVRQLLSNRSGLPAWRPFFEGVRPEDCPVPLEEILPRILSEPLDADPGAGETYSDLGFILLGWFLQQAGRGPLEDLFRKELAQPLRLRKTGFRKTTGVAGEEADCTEDVAATEYCGWRGRMLIGEVHDENCYMLGGVAGHAGLFSTAKELDRFVVQVFRGLRGQASLFDREALGLFLGGPEPSFPGTWALGWDTPSPRNSATGHFFSPHSCGHNGFTGTSLWMDLDRRVSVILLTNRVHPSRDNLSIRKLRPRVHDAILEEILCPQGGSGS